MADDIWPCPTCKRPAAYVAPSERHRTAGRVLMDGDAHRHIIPATSAVLERYGVLALQLRSDEIAALRAGSVIEVDIGGEYTLVISTTPDGAEDDDGQE